MIRRPLVATVVLMTAVLQMAPPVVACTGITLKAKDGAVVYGRTLEWGKFSMKSRVMIVPRGYKFGGHIR